MHIAQQTHAIKFRLRGSKKWFFATPRGRATLLRVHAALMSKDKAQQTAMADTDNNPTLEFKVVNMEVA